ncbi:MAG: DNA replication complex GINS family protein [Candidatus Diapherotrites archaeon]|nr:DNA replication complex GINS family protein [Candidatus Diapherotrites archaeon]
MKLDYEELRRIHRLEKSTSQIVKVDVDFFSELKKFMQEQKKEYLKAIKELDSAKAKSFENLRKLVEEIFLIRERKLLNKALIASRTNELDDSGLAEEEKQALRKMIKIINSHRDNLYSILEEKKLEEESITVKIVKPVEVFIGPDKKEYGPFEENQSVSLPKKVALLLIKNNLAEEI